LSVCETHLFSFVGFAALNPHYELRRGDPAEAARYGRVFELTPVAAD